MNTLRNTLGAVFVAGGLIMLGGCEDSDVTVTTDAIIELTSQPGSLKIDPNTDVPDPGTGRFQKTATVSAFVFDVDNIPQQGVTLAFSTDSSGGMDPVSVKTDENGRAQSTLTVTDLDSPMVTVQARSGSVTGSADVTVQVVGINELPRATATIIPLMQGQVGQVITFDGSGSTDPDGNITCYQWQFLSDNPDDPTGPNPEIIQGAGASGVQTTFSNEQTLAVTLRVSDRTDIACEDVDDMNPGGMVEPESVFSPLAFRTNYALTCNNPPPTAVIAGPDTITANGSPSTLTSITLDGTLSFDNQTQIDRWVWTCGNDQAPIPVAPNGSIVVCRYRPGTFTATLNVVDRGTGVINPATGTWDCQKSSAADTVEIIVSVPAS